MDDSMVYAQSEYPKYTPMIAKILEGLISGASEHDKHSHYQEVIAVANEVINNIDKEVLVVVQFYHSVIVLRSGVLHPSYATVLLVQLLNSSPLLVRVKHMLTQGGMEQGFTNDKVKENKKCCMFI